MERDLETVSPPRIGGTLPHDEYIRVLYSIAKSLKRIADVLEKQPGSEEGRSSTVFGIRKVGATWRCFDDTGDLPGEFEDAEAARWGAWITAQDAANINGKEARAINTEDVRERMRRRLAEAEAAESR